MTTSKILFVLIFICTFIPLSYSATGSSNCTLFNFGDSNSATGIRFSNGRVYLDYICENLGLPDLGPYNESSADLDSRHGINFAVGGAGTINLFAPNASLPTQITQFGSFQNRTQRLIREGKRLALTDNDFKNAVYTIDIGQNDLSLMFNGSSYEFIVNKMVPEVLERVENVVQELHRLGARKFWLYNTGPLGCLPASINARTTYSEESDGIGCRLVYNNVAKAFNRGFGVLCDAMRAHLKDAEIVCTDMFSIKYDLFANPGKYGFKFPFSTCCDSCELPHGFRCPYPSQWVLWDPVHYTEAANKAVAMEILSGNHSFPPGIKLRDLCNK